MQSYQSYCVTAGILLTFFQILPFKLSHQQLCRFAAIEGDIVQVQHIVLIYHHKHVKRAGVHEVFISLFVRLQNVP